MTFLQDFELRAAGFDEAQIAEIQAAIPKAQQLATIYQQHLELVKQVEQLVNDLVPTWAMVLAVLRDRAAK